MLNDVFPTVEDVVKGLDAQVKANEEHIHDLEQRSRMVDEETRKSYDVELQKFAKEFTVDNLINHQLNYTKLDPAQNVLIETFVSKIERLQEIRRFSELVRKIDHVLKALQTCTNIVDSAPMYHNELRPLISEVKTYSVLGSVQDLLLTQVANATGDIKKQAFSNLKAALGPEWPQKNPSSQEFLDALKHSLMVDDPDLEDSLETFNIMSSALDLRIRFNFESDRKTCQIDKPEWLFQYFFKLVDPHLSWLKGTVQPLLSQVFPQFLALNCFCSSLLPSVFHAAKFYLENCKYEGPLLHHFIEESFKFDHDIIENYFFYFSADWLGLTTTSLVNDESAFDLWFNYEKASVDAQFAEISKNPQAWVIDYDSTDISLMSRPIVFGLNLGQLFDQTTDLYKNLRAQRLQLRFLNEIQLNLIDDYVAALKQCKNHPQADFDDYGKVLGSVSYLIQFLTQRNNQLLFIDIHDAIRVLGDGLFDEVIDSLEVFKTTCVDELGRLFSKAFGQLFKQYIRNRQFSDELSQELFAPCSKLKQRLQGFRKIFNSLDYELLIVKFSTELAEFLRKNVVQAGRFTPNEGIKLDSEIDYLWTELGLMDVPKYNYIKGAAEFYHKGETLRLTSEETADLERRRQ